MDAPALSPPARHTRLMRSYALREDADRACEVLADSGIGSSVRDLHAPAAKAGKTVYPGCALSVAPEDAAAAARLLLKMPPSEAPAAQRAAAAREKPARRDAPQSRLIRRAGPAPKQRGSFLMIGIAVACAAGAIIFSGVQMMTPKTPYQPPRTVNYHIEEDLNGDTLPDVIREFTPNWEPVFHAEDRNHDAEFDIQWTYQRGRPATREVDVNYDGKYDERTTFDAEGQPFFTDLRPSGSGPVLRRTIMRHGLIWKILEDRDADSHFDHLRELDRYAGVLRDEVLPPDSPENAQPKGPLPPWPDEEDQEPKLLITPGTPRPE